MGKARVAVRIKDAISSTKKSNNRSMNVETLSQRFEVVKKNIEVLIGALRKHHAMMQGINTTRLGVANAIAAFTENTPLHPSGGSLNGESSYAAIHKLRSEKTIGYHDKYAQFVIEYVVEWHRVVNTRVNNGLKIFQNLRRDLDHYQTKVESLRQSVNQALAKGKTVEPKTQEKLARNEEKMVKSKQAYDKTARDMCLLLEEIVDRAWKELHVVLIKLAQFDSTLATDEARGLSGLDSVISALKKLASEHDLEPTGRLKELEKQDPTSLYTGSESTSIAITDGNGHDTPIMGSGGTIGGGGGGSGYYDVDDEPALPPGSVAPQGMGGFPVQIANSGSNEPVDTSSSYPNVHHEPEPFSTRLQSSGSSLAPEYSQPPTTSDMMAVAASAAPPPTMDEVNNSLRNSMSVSGNQRRPSFNTRNSIVSNASDDPVPYYPPPAAPPLGAPPPPPPPGGYPMLPPSGTAPSHTQSWAAPSPVHAPHGRQSPYGHGASSPAYMGGVPTPRGASGTNPFDPPGQNTQYYGRADPPSTNPFNY